MNMAGRATVVLTAEKEAILIVWKGWRGGGKAEMIEFEAQVAKLTFLDVTGQSAP